MPSLLARLRQWLAGPGPRPEDAAAFLDDLFSRFPFAVEVQEWLRHEIRTEVHDPGSTEGGGGWHAAQRLVQLRTAQYEAAIHELAHAVWETRRRDRGLRDALVAAVQRLAEDDDAHWERASALARNYVHGIAEQPEFEQGLLLPRWEWGRGGGAHGEWNDWEMYAGLASGCMADLRLLPPYLRRFYRGLFDELPSDAPSPEGEAPHR
jgi:hypothetical protein